jgi:opacity protein-like surface antigen
VNSLYQSDLTYGLASQTFGAGGAIAITDNIKVNLGASYTQYMKDTKTIDHILSGTTTDITATESYKKNAIIFGAGIDLNF